MLASLVSIASGLSGALRTGAGVLLLTVLVVGPLNFGSTRVDGLRLLTTLGAAAGLLWLLSCALGAPWHAPSRVALIGAIICAGVALIWLGRPAPELPPFTAQHFARVTARWPTSMVPRSPGVLIAWSLTVIVMLLVFADLARAPQWRLAFVSTAVATGVVAAVVGLLQNATHARGIYWQPGPRMPGVFFGPFYHHTSAGAYLNSVWPLAGVLALSGVRDATRRGRWFAGLGGAATLLLLAAHAGHVSRFPQVVAALVLVVATAWLRPWRLIPAEKSFRVSVLLAFAVAGGVVVTFGAGKVDTIRARWSELSVSALFGRQEYRTPPPPETWPKRMRGDLFVASDHGGYVLGDRGAAYGAAWRAIEHRPWLGWGPGGWIAAAAAHSVDPFVRTFFLYLQFVHNDYLQTLVEWGLVGAVGWALLVWGGVLHALRQLARQPALDLFGAGAVAALMALFAQSLVDFPLQIPAIQLNATLLTALTWSVGSSTTPAVSFRNT